MDSVKCKKNDSSGYYLKVDNMKFSETEEKYLNNGQVAEIPNGNEWNFLNPDDKLLQDNVDETENLPNVIMVYSPPKRDLKIEDNLNTLQLKNIMYKSRFTGNKFGLSELSNDKTYLETELPSRKRFKLETEFFNSNNRQCETIYQMAENDSKLVDYASQANSFSEKLSTLSNGQNLIKTLKSEKMFSESGLIVSNCKNNGFYQNVSNLPENILMDQCKHTDTELVNCNLENKPEYSDLNISNKYSLIEKSNIYEIKSTLNEESSESDFDVEVRKCCELLNLDSSENHEGRNLCLEKSDAEISTLVANSPTEQNGQNMKHGDIILDAEFKLQIQSKNQEKVICQNGVNSSNETDEDLFPAKMDSEEEFLTIYCDESDIDFLESEILDSSVDNDKSDKEINKHESNESELIEFARTLESDISEINQNCVNSEVNINEKNETVSDICLKKASNTEVIENYFSVNDEHKILDTKETAGDDISTYEIIYESSSEDERNEVTVFDNEVSILEENDIDINESQLTENGQNLISDLKVEISPSTSKNGTGIGNFNSEDENYAVILEDHEVSKAERNFNDLCGSNWEKDVNISKIQAAINGKYVASDPVQDISSDPCKNTTTDNVATGFIKDASILKNYESSVTRKDNIEGKEIDTFVSNSNVIKTVNEKNTNYNISQTVLSHIDKTNPFIDKFDSVDQKNENYFNLMNKNIPHLTDQNVATNVDENDFVLFLHQTLTKSKELYSDCEVLTKKEIPLDANKIHSREKIEITAEFRTCNSGKIDNIVNSFKNIGEKSAENTVKHIQSIKCVSNHDHIVSGNVKTDSNTTEGNEIKPVNPTPDYYEEEKDDLINPGWNKVKELSTDEERYRQVKDCWKSASIPNPYKNLTYHSYRKRHLKNEGTRQIKQHKRHASSSLNDQNAKRSRSCTYIFDNQIKSIEKKKEKQASALKTELNKKISHLNNLCHEEEVRIQNQLNPYMHHFYRQIHAVKLDNVRAYYRNQVSLVTQEYMDKANQHDTEYLAGIDTLKQQRNEVLQFFSFYKGLHMTEQKDPTILTKDQVQELDEIENIYSQLHHYYK